MCGICGMVDFSGAPPTEDGLRAMTATLRHRGADDDPLARLQAKETAEAFFERADKAVYSAKRNGRNRSLLG